MPSHDEYKEFEQQRAPASYGTPIEQQLRNYFEPQSSETDHEVLFGYYQWLDWYGSTVEISEQLKGDWNPAKEVELRYALKAFRDTRTLALGYSSGTKAQHVVTPVMCSAYRAPRSGSEGLDPKFDPLQAYGPVLYTDRKIHAPGFAVSSKTALETLKNHSTFSEAEGKDPAIALEDSNTSIMHCSGASSRTVIPAMAPSMEWTPELPSALRQRFTTKLIHLGRIDAFVPDPTADDDSIADDDSTEGTLTTKTPYAAVAAIYAGRVEGIFAIPVDRPRRHTILDDYLRLEAWEPEKRGVYYLGMNLEDCAEREWKLCDEVDIIEVISVEDERDKTP